ncbi:MAG: cytochrome c biogenesis CcdA family protein [Candidatus Zixiibacteriota bacterium]
MNVFFKNYTAILLLGIAVFITAIFPQVANAQDKESVEIVFFHSHGCNHCDSIYTEFIVPALEKYGDKIDLESYDVDDPEKGDENYTTMLEYEDRYDDHGNDFPSVIIGGKFLGNTSEIRPVFNDILQKELAKLESDDDTKAIEEKEITKSEDKESTDSDSSEADSISKADEEMAEADESKKIPEGTLYIIYFNKAGCDHCSRVHRNLKYIENQYPNIVIKEFDVENADGASLSEYLSSKHDIPSEKHLAAPAVFAGDGYLILDEIQFHSILELLREQGEKAKQDISDVPDKELAMAYEKIKDKFSEVSIWTVIGAGLIDGINPCAFGVIIFFITFLTVMKRSKSEMLITGIAFTISVFVTYFLVGIGILKFLIELKAYEAITNWIYLLMGIFVAVLAVLSIVDFIRTRKGKSKDMLLQLPSGIKKRMHKIIRKESKAKTKFNMVLAALSTGFLVSLMEMACTGQVYLPMITVMTQTPDARVKAIAYLLLYNLMFILPLVIIFSITMAGVSSQKMGQFLEKNTYLIKILLTLLFIGLGYYLLMHVDFSMILGLFGAGT